MPYSDLTVCEVNNGCRFKIADSDSVFKKIEDATPDGICRCIDESSGGVVNVNGYATITDYL